MARPQSQPAGTGIGEVAVHGTSNGGQSHGRFHVASAGCGGFVLAGEVFGLLPGGGLGGGAEAPGATGQGTDKPLDAGAALRGGVALVPAAGAVADVDGQHCGPV